MAKKPKPPHPHASPPRVWIGIAAMSEDGMTVQLSMQVTTQVGTTVDRYGLVWGDELTVTPFLSGAPPVSETHTYVADGDYLIRLVVIDTAGLSGEATVPASIRFRNSNVFVPTTISPPAGGLAVAGAMPQVSPTAIAITRQPPAGAVALSGTLSSLAVTSTVPLVRQPPAGSLSLAGRTMGVAMGVAGPVVSQPAAGSVVAAGKIVGVFKAPIPTGDHPYFDGLLAHPGLYTSASLRDPAQLVSRSLGGYAQKSPPYYVTYSPGTDTDPQAQDAAKVVVPLWGATVYTLESAISASDTSITASFIGNSGWNQFSIRFLDTGEIVTIPAASTNGETHTIFNLLRGQRGTAAAPHAIGAQFVKNAPSLPNQVRVPIGTVDGHTYLFTWDSYYTTSCVLRAVPGKTFQLTSRGIWFEPGIDPVGNTNNNASTSIPSGRIPAPGFLPGVDVGTWRTRLYNAYGGVSPYAPTPFPGQCGPGIINVNPIGPSAAVIVKPGRWYRHWVQIDQRANDYDYTSQWIADAVSGVVTYHSALPVALRNEDHQIAEWYIEVNTSDNALPTNLVDLVMYVKNFAVLQDVNPAPLLNTIGL